MGQGLSRRHRHHRSSSVVVSSEQPSAVVIAADGSLREFFFPANSSSSSPATVRDVLGGDGGNEEDDRRVFLCSSDALYFGEDVPPLGAGELLRPGQVYFVLPAAMLGRPLSSADMAKLAVRASEALLASTKAAWPRGRGISRKARVAPVRAESGRGDVDGEVNEKLNERTLGECVTATWASPPRNAEKVAVASAAARSSPRKRPLATIEEDAE